jgi:hypothetical protein
MLLAILKVNFVINYEMLHVRDEPHGVHHPSHGTNALRVCAYGEAMPGCNGLHAKHEDCY